ncbi:MAG TPA: hypothetical protein PLA19_05850, partial [Candidatus Pacearchaeota archaeon]|nr:hypothetical protein [Candidatus Pacearchaeota archaeon]
MKKLLLICILGILFFPSIAVMVWAQSTPEISFSLTVVEKTIGGDDIFNFKIEEEKLPPVPMGIKNLLSVFAADEIFDYPYQFSITTQNGQESYSADYSMHGFSIMELSQFQNPGWELKSVECDSTFGQEGESYFIHDNFVVFNSIQDGENIYCEFTNKKIDNPDKFVYVALGDSYQSGEGAGNSIQDSARYLSEAYEQGTYTDTLVSGNDSCHRALQNYAKINKNKFKPELSDDDIVLIDLTCSGAKIETGPRPPVVGDMASNQIAPNSQLQQALDKLGEAGLAPADVDLVTVGMGGNDAKFTDLVYACVLPNILRR